MRILLQELSHQGDFFGPGTDRPRLCEPVCAWARRGDFVEEDNELTAGLASAGFAIRVNLDATGRAMTNSQKNPCSNTELMAGPFICTRVGGAAGEAVSFPRKHVGERFGSLGERPARNLHAAINLLYPAAHSSDLELCQ